MYFFETVTDFNRLPPITLLGILLFFFVDWRFCGGDDDADAVFDVAIILVRVDSVFKTVVVLRIQLIFLLVELLGNLLILFLYAMVFLETIFEKYDEVKQNLLDWLYILIILKLIFFPKKL